MRDAGGTCTSLGFRAQVLVASLSFSFDASLFRSSFCVACRPRDVHFVRGKDLRRGACRRGDVLFGRKSLFAAFLFDCRPSCMTTHQCVTFVVVTVKPQQSPESSICPTLEPGQVVGSRVSSSTLLRLGSASAVRVRGRATC